MPSRARLLFAVAVLAVALVTGLLALWVARAPEQPIAIGKPLIGGPFSLTDQNGKRVTEQDFHGKFMLVFFGYTYCPDVCPGELQVMSAALDRLGPAAQKITPVFITVDPARDTPEVLKSYVANFHPRLVGLTGSEEDVAKAAKAFRVYYKRVDGGSPEAPYLMDHTAIAYLMAPDGSYATHFPYDTNVDHLVDGLRKAIGS